MVSGDERIEIADPVPRDRGRRVHRAPRRRRDPVAVGVLAERRARGAAAQPADPRHAGRRADRDGRARPLAAGSPTATSPRAIGRCVDACSTTATAIERLIADRRAARARSTSSPTSSCCSSPTGGSASRARERPARAQPRAASASASSSPTSASSSTSRRRSTRCSRRRIRDVEIIVANDGSLRDEDAIVCRTSSAATARASSRSPTAASARRATSGSRRPLASSCCRSTPTTRSSRRSSSAASTRCGRGPSSPT